MSHDVAPVVKANAAARVKNVNVAAADRLEDFVRCGCRKSLDVAGAWTGSSPSDAIGVVKKTPETGKGPRSLFPPVSSETNARALQPFVNAIVDETGMTSNGDPKTRRVEISFRRDRVLIVAELVAGVGEELDECDPDVRNVRFGP